MRNFLHWMGNVNNKMKHKHKKQINHENIDVNRSKTLQVLEHLKSEDSNHMHSYPELIIHSNINMDRGDNSPQTESIPRNNIVTNHRSYSAPQFQSTVTSDNVQIRKVLKDGRIVEEVVPCDKLEYVVHVKANNSQYQQSSDLSEQNQTDSTVDWDNDNDDLNVSSEPFPSEYFSDEDEPLTTDDVEILNKMGKEHYKSMKYHAYVNYPDEYFPAAKKIAERLEKPPYNYRLFLPDRQLLAGCCDKDAKSNIVENRCSGKVISLLGQKYTNSDAFHFINYFAKSLDPISKEVKLIPVLIDEIEEIPRIMKGMYLIKYHKDGDRGFFWDKLSNSIRNGKESKSCPSRLNKMT